MAANDRHPMEEVVDRRDLLAPKTTGVVVYADKPTYPVITTSPTFSQMGKQLFGSDDVPWQDGTHRPDHAACAVTAIRPEEWLGVAAWTVGGAALGYYMGA